MCNNFGVGLLNKNIPVLKYCMGQAIPIMPKFWSAPPLFLEDEDIFQKSASMVPSGIEIELEPWSPIF